jgi:hypothetical protein
VGAQTAQPFEPLYSKADALRWCMQVGRGLGCGWA